jgi:hypothetical protein
MMVVIEQGYRLTLAKLVSVFGLLSAFVFARAAHADDSLLKASISEAFKDARAPVSGTIAGSGGCSSGGCSSGGCSYAQGSYQAYYQGYYEGSYQTTFTNNTTINANASILGSVSKASGSFVIDDPLDPVDKLLYHSFVESPEAKNLYDGIAQLDQNGEAVIKLPDYFDALNGDVRYQLKPISGPMPNLYVKEEEKNNRFTVGGGVSGGKISWQVTGVRHDAYILANPIVPVVEKGPGQLVDKGQYLFPDGYKPVFPLSGLWKRIAALFASGARD